MPSFPPSLPFSGRCWVLYAAVAWLAGCGGGGGGGGSGAARAGSPCTCPCANRSPAHFPPCPCGPRRRWMCGLSVPHPTTRSTTPWRSRPPSTRSRTASGSCSRPVSTAMTAAWRCAHTRAVLWSDGATLHATNPDDQAVLLAADGASLYNFTLTAVTRGRLDAPWQSRIAIFDTDSRATRLANNVVQGNRVINGGAPGSPTANSASSAGIYVEFAENFLIAGNEVRRSLADGININGGARNGRVLFNTVRESGDDMIGLVSYMGTGNWITSSAASLAASLDAQRDRQLVRNVLVAHNDVSGQYFRARHQRGGRCRHHGARQPHRAHHHRRRHLRGPRRQFRDLGREQRAHRGQRGEPGADRRTCLHAGRLEPGRPPHRPRRGGDLFVRLRRRAQRPRSVGGIGGAEHPGGAHLGHAGPVCGCAHRRGHRRGRPPDGHRRAGARRQPGPLGWAGRPHRSGTNGARQHRRAGARHPHTRTTAADNVVCTAVTANGQPIGDLACGGSQPAVSGASQTCAR